MTSKSLRRLSRNDDVPLYQQIKIEISGQIRRGALETGSATALGK